MLRGGHIGGAVSGCYTTERDTTLVGEHGSVDSLTNVLPAPVNLLVFTVSRADRRQAE